MASCLPKSKHVKLTQACYPKSKTAPARPNQSELQYLTYYAASRPKKLLKVGSYLRQRTLKDAYWKRQTEMMVTLDICNTLIGKCQTNLNLFAADVIAILQTVLDTHDMLCMQHTLICFSTFCKYHDGTANDPITVYTESSYTLLQTYSRLAQGPSPTNLLGTQALMNTCTAPTMQSKNRIVHVPLLLSTALHNLASNRPESLYQLRSQLDQHRDSIASLTIEGRAADGQSSVMNIQTPEMQDTPQQAQLEACSLNIIKNIFSSNNSGRIRMATNKILEHTENRKEVDKIWSSTLIRIAAEWVPINLRFHVLGACLDYLTSIEVPIESNLASQRQADVLNIVYMLLTSKISLIGLSTNDVMDSLLNVTCKLPSSFDNAYYKLGEEREPDSDTLLVSLPEQTRVTHLRKLMRTMVAITSHPYYKDQVSDMFRFLLNRAAAVESSGQSPNEGYQGFHLDVACELLRASNFQCEADRDSPRVKPLAMIPGLILLKSSAYVRRKFAFVLYTFLIQECSSELRPSEVNNDAHENNSMYNHDGSFDHDHEFGRLIRNAMYSFLRDPNTDTKDLDLGFDIVKNLYRVLPISELVRFVPLLYRLSQAGQHNQLRNGIQFKTLLKNSLLCIVHQCSRSASEKMFNAENEGDGLPEFSLVTNFLRTTLGNELSDSQLSAMSETWNPEDADRVISRAVSIRNSQRNRLVSSATASREHFNLGSGTILAGKPATGRIQALKQALDVDPFSPSPNASTFESMTVTSLNMLFKDIEMTELGKDESNDRSVLRAHSAAAQTLAQPFPTTQSSNSNTAPSLGRVVA